MSWETFYIYGKSVQVNVRETHRDKVKDALGKVKACEQPIEDFIKIIEDQKAEIPEHYGEKDELGENIETYLTEIQEKVQEKIVKNFESIMDKEVIMDEKAHNIDRDNARYEYMSSHPKPVEKTLEKL